ncbi:hypothetical protein [Actinomadura sp. 9N215]|uniref:hypothetical protein n=1 Tax=Actinomadura sp. 9N215 TaxID=3375150 RepID=UPI00378D2CAB
MGRRRYRRLLVGPDTYRWRTAHQHSGDGRRFVDCREVVLLRKEGRPGRINVVFRAGPGRIVPDGGPYTHSGGVRRAGDDTVLNLHLPRVVRALVDIALARGEDFGSSTEIDGWDWLDAVRAHLDGESRDETARCASPPRNSRVPGSSALRPPRSAPRPSPGS